jgi:hypothetical protein
LYKEKRSGIAWLKARIWETTMDKERIWEGVMTPPFLGWRTETWI